MKIFNRILMWIGFVAICITTSCSKDDPENEIVNELFLDGVKFTPTFGLAADGVDETHYHWAFVLSDQPFSFDTTNEYDWGEGTTFVTMIFASSFGIEEFTPGIFRFSDPLFDPPNRNYVQGNFDDRTDSSNTGVFLTGGSVTITGSSPNFTLEFDVVMTGGKKLTGTYSGTFEIFE